MNPSHPLLSPSVSRLVRLRDGLAALPDLGPLYLQVRGPGGGLGKSVSSFQPFFVEGLDFAFDPDCGAGFSIRDLAAIHLSRPTPESYFDGSLEFEFTACPQGLALHLLPDPDDIRRLSLDELLALVPTEPLEAQALDEWRGARRQPAPMCPCCAERARQRSRFPDRHPIHGILHHVLSHRLEFDCRLPAAHADLTAAFIPSRIEARDGFLIASDAPALHALHLDMARLHALAIDTVRLDGCDYSEMRLFDPRGFVTFRILCEDASLAAVWRGICEEATS